LRQREIGPACEEKKKGQRHCTDDDEDAYAAIGIYVSFHGRVSIDPALPPHVMPDAHYVDARAGRNRCYMTLVSKFSRAWNDRGIVPGTSYGD
jgi:hypothetical protein